MNNNYDASKKEDSNKPTHPRNADELLDTIETSTIYDAETIRIGITPSLQHYIRILSNQQVPPSAIRQYITSPIRIKLSNRKYVEYPSPADAWTNDPMYRRWVKRIGKQLLQYSRQNKEAFNILRFVTVISNYTRSKTGFLAWHDKKHKAGHTQKPSWLRNQLNAEKNP